MRHTWLSWINPITCARNIFRPESADVEEPYQRYSDWRAGVGIACVLLLSLPGNRAADVIVERLVNSYLAFFVSVTLVAVFSAVYRTLKSADMSDRSRRAINQVWLRLLVLVGVFGLTAVVYVLNGGDGVPTAPYLMVPGLWLALFSFPMTWYGLRWGFGVSDIHPFLGPLVTSLTAAASFIIDRHLETGIDLEPKFIQGAIKIAALVSVVILSICEANSIKRSRGDQRGGAASFSRPPRRRPPYSQLAVTAFFLTIFMPPIGIPVTLVALVRVARNKERGAGLAVASLLVGIGIMAAVFNTVGQTSTAQGPEPTRSPPSRSGSRVGENGLMFRTARWEVRLSRLREVDGGVRADVAYRNIGTVTTTITCDNPTGGSALIFASDTVPMTDGRCVSALGTVSWVKPGTTFRTWGFFPATGHQGEKFAIRWWSFGTTPPAFSMPS
jgi:hypothetical protein